QKRLRWFGHALRQPKGMIQRDWIESQIETDSKWMKLVRRDVEDRGGRWKYIRQTVLA
ncbi:hypothetical protein Pmar_PMAR028101, partial [Perkinsus marinus ATCC 50983]